jgi:hypothetical protein
MKKAEDAAQDNENKELCKITTILSAFQYPCPTNGYRDPL